VKRRNNKHREERKEKILKEKDCKEEGRGEKKGKKENIKYWKIEVFYDIIHINQMWECLS
jgi:hypothetical protein